MVTGLQSLRVQTIFKDLSFVMPIEYPLDQYLAGHGIRQEPRELPVINFLTLPPVLR